MPASVSARDAWRHGAWATTAGYISSGCTRPSRRRPAACRRGPNPILSQFSDDGGESFSRPVQVNDPQRELSVAPAIAVGRDHALHVLDYDLEDDRGRSGGRLSG